MLEEIDALLWVCFSDDICNYGALIGIKAIHQYGSMLKFPAHTSGVRRGGVAPPPLRGGGGGEGGGGGGRWGGGVEYPGCLALLCSYLADLR